ncbi:hypothetical protein OHA98_37855 [Streptomyces sp. NBC_00654]|uniref:hypothetical protein n=1 Tax=Streptomyces sp. NBC_00654 TaxID=2975799 RepID=UPI00224CD3BB|nr:hypothetical protein [Streptomyces sp. NBC_00654]MCX4970422.1 hypothetical protein [Streptomyces sp. NBC_00654]
MSRTQWCCLTAVLAVVLGLFCGPAATAVPAARDTAVAVPAVAVPVGVAAAVSDAGADADAGVDGSTAVPDVSAAAGDTAVLAGEDRGGSGIPGCGKKRSHDGTEPAAPVRARAPNDQAPGLVQWGLPAAIGQEPARALVRIRLCVPAPATPTPVELSVLRV